MNAFTDKSDALSSYKHDMQFYNTDPIGFLSLAQLRKVLYERFIALQIITNLTTENQEAKLEVCQKKFVKQLKKLGYVAFAELLNGKGCDINTEERIKIRYCDHISHSILLLICSQSREMLFWFQRMEEYLFRWRLNALNSEGIKAFKIINNIDYTVVEQEEKLKLKDELMECMKNSSNFDTTVFYKVDATSVMDSLFNAYIHEGTAYITESEFYSEFYFRYCKLLKSKIKKSRGAVFHIDDPRIFGMAREFKTMFRKFLALNQNPDTIKTDELDELSITSFPPCMRKLHENLRLNSHLRNMGRVQYTLFLKRIGVEAEEAVSFFKEIFTKVMDEHHFEKEHSYKFRHLYGLVGAQNTYNVWDCVKCANCKPGLGEYHGCPFATDDIENLSEMLSNWNIDKRYSTEIIQLSQEKNYDVACSTYFEATHDGCPIGCSIQNPYDFFANSLIKHANKHVDFIKAELNNTKNENMVHSDRSFRKHSNGKEDDVRKSNVHLRAVRLLNTLKSTEDRREELEIKLGGSNFRWHEDHESDDCIIKAKQVSKEYLECSRMEKPITELGDEEESNSSDESSENEVNSDDVDMFADSP